MSVTYVFDSDVDFYAELNKIVMKVTNMKKQKMNIKKQKNLFNNR